MRGATWILIECATGFVVHRWLGSVMLGSRPGERPRERVVHVIHAGDSPSARPGIVPATQVRGLVRAIVRPEGRPVPGLRDLPIETRRRHSRFRARWMLYARLLPLVEVVPALCRLLAGAPARAVRRSFGIG